MFKKIANIFKGLVVGTFNVIKNIVKGTIKGVVYLATTDIKITVKTETTHMAKDEPEESETKDPVLEPKKEDEVVVSPTTVTRPVSRRRKLSQVSPAHHGETLGFPPVVDSTVKPNKQLRDGDVLTDPRYKGLKVRSNAFAYKNTPHKQIEHDVVDIDYVNRYELWHDGINPNQPPLTQAVRTDLPKTSPYYGKFMYEIIRDLESRGFDLPYKLKDLR